MRNSCSVGEMGVLMLSLDLCSGPHSQQNVIQLGFHGHALTWRSDNMAVVSTINSGKAKDDFIAKGLRY